MISKTLSQVLVHSEEIFRLRQIEHLLGWDEQVNLPPQSITGRAAQLSSLASVIHDKATDPEFGKKLEELSSDKDELTPKQKTIVKEAYSDYLKAIRVPNDFIVKRAKAQSESYHAWTEARKENNFSHFASHLSNQFSIAKEEAAFFDFTHPYDYWLDKHDPGLDHQQVKALFGALKTPLVPLVDELTASPQQSLFQGRNFPIDQQKIIIPKVLTSLGFDFNKGRLDTAVHPFCGGSGDDIRITTRYRPDDPFDAIFSAIHEAGHGIYEQNLPQSPLGTIFTENAGMAVHESQSRIWENQVGRSREFWEFWYPEVKVQFNNSLENVSLDEWHKEVLRVSKKTIRVDSDEVTYNLHIILRTELELLLFEDQITVEELPAAWNKKTHELFGFSPQSNQEGVLQDVHWSCGAIGYFPSYTLGNMIAAQLWKAVRRENPNLEQEFAHGNFTSLTTWLTDNVHSVGKTQTALALTKKVTGEDLSPDALINYLKERYEQN